MTALEVVRVTGAAALLVSPWWWLALPVWVAAHGGAR